MSPKVHPQHVEPTSSAKGGQEKSETESHGAEEGCQTRPKQLERFRIPTIHGHLFLHQVRMLHMLRRQ